MHQFVTLATKDAATGGDPRGVVRKHQSLPWAQVVQCEARVQQALALVAEPDRAMRELMRGTIERAGFVVLEVAALHHLDVLLRTRVAAIAPRVVLVALADMVAACPLAVTKWVDHRVALRRPSPCVVLTCEFGTPRDAPSPDLNGCVSLGILERPFDLVRLQGMAYRARTLSPDAKPFVVIGG